jgi:multidrug efflux system membrane fusion protein
MKLRTLVVLLGLAALIAGGIAYKIWFAQTPAAPSAGTRGTRGSGDGPLPVLAVRAERTDVPVELDGIGTVQALNTVTVRPQVDGRLISLHFKDGDTVKTGDILAKIDPKTYQAALDQALAKKAQDEAQLANARRDLERYTNLARTEYATQQQADTQRSVVAQLVAQVDADQAAIDNAKAILDYTTIRAPLDGRTGLRLVDQGNLLRASDQTGIVTITQVQPIAVIFNLPQQQLRAVNQAMMRGPVTIEAREADNLTVIDRGLVEVIDNQVDQTTGTVRIKARFANAQLALWPGQFVNVRLRVDTLKDAITVPTASIQRGPLGPFVYVVDAESFATQRPVTLARQTETVTAIATGVGAGDQVVTSGFNRLTDKTLVRIDEPKPAGGEPPAPRPQGERRKSNGGGNSGGTSQP